MLKIGITFLLFVNLLFAEQVLKIYVSKNGNDANDGKTLSTAVRSLQKAYEKIDSNEK